jgi:uncharacterized damage-inducible protein DinB
MEDQLLETWNIHNRINLYLLESIPVEALSAICVSKGRSVGEQFAHIHNVRLMWLKSAMPELLADLAKIETQQKPAKNSLAEALQNSGKAIESLLKKSLASGGRIKGFKPHAIAFLGYLISHESHHRGQISLALKQSGYKLDQKIAFGLWEWGTR